MGGPPVDVSDSHAERPALGLRSVHDGGVEFGSALGCLPDGNSRLYRVLKMVADEVEQWVGLLPVERPEALSHRGDELSAVLHEAWECDASQVDMAFDAGLDVVGNLAVDLLEKRGKGTKHTEIMVDPWSKCFESADDGGAVSDRQLAGADEGADVA
jgi:hypothetical protein